MEEESKDIINHSCYMNFKIFELYLQIKRENADGGI